MIINQALQSFNRFFWSTPQRPYLFLFLIGTLVWANSIHSGYVHLDTQWLVINNPILSTGSPQALLPILGDLSLGNRLTLGAEYLPLRDISVLLDFALFSTNWKFHHLVNLFWYLGSCLLLLGIFFEFLGKNWRAWSAALLFAIHPTHVESVSWLASRKDLLSLFFFFLALLLYLRSTSWRGILGATIFGLCAYWSKNTAIALPPLLVLCSLLHKKESPKEGKWWLQWIPIAFVFSIGLYFTIYVGKMVSMFAESRADSFWGNLSITAQAWYQYLWMLFFPTNLTIFYVEPTTSSAFPVWVGFGCMLGTTIGAWALHKKNPQAALGLIWIGLGLLPVSQLTPIQNLIADRYLLIPSAGFMLFLSSIWPGKMRIHPAVLVCSLSVFWTLLTVKRLPVWHNTTALWQDLTEKQPYEPRGWANLAGQYSEKGNPEKAKEIIQKGLQKLPSHPLLFQGLGLVYLHQEQDNLAEQYLKTAWKNDKALRKAANNLAFLHRRNKRNKAAEQIAEELVLLHPKYPNGWNTLGAIYIDQKELKKAEHALLKAHSLEPFNSTPLANLGNVAYLRKNYEQAKIWWQKTLMLKPRHQHAIEGLEHLQMISK